MRRICEGPGCGSDFDAAVHNQKYCSQECKRNAERDRSRSAYTHDVAEALAKTVAPAYMEALDDEQHLEYLRKEVIRLTRLSDKQKSVNHEIVDSVYKAMYDAVSSIKVPQVKAPQLYGGGGDEEVANVICADWQLGKLTPTYDSEVCRQRIDVFGDKIMRLTDIQRADHPVRGCHLWFLGDIVEGENIFPGQAYLVDSGLYRQVGVNGPEIASKLIQKLLNHFDWVKVVGVIGNHGRLTKRDYDPESNMDRLLYTILELMFANDDRVSFDIPSGARERHWYAVDTIGEYSTLLIHGDQLPPPTSFHTYYKKVMGWKDGAIPETFQDVYMGHYHQSVKATLGSSMLRVAGSPESYNTFAQEVLAAMGRPSQPLQFIHPEQGVTAEYTVYLD